MSQISDYTLIKQFMYYADLCHEYDNFAHYARLVAKYINIDYILSGVTALEVATLNNCVKHVKLLLDLGADPNLKKYVSNYTPLMIASKSLYPDAIEIVKLLLSAKADPTIIGQNGETALSLASTNGSFDILLELLKDTRSIDLLGLKNSNGLTTLEIMKNSLDILESSIELQKYQNLNIAKNIYSFAKDRYEKKKTTELLTQYIGKDITGIISGYMGRNN